MQQHSDLTLSCFAPTFLEARVGDCQELTVFTQSLLALSREAGQGTCQLGAPERTWFVPVCSCTGGSTAFVKFFCTLFCRVIKESTVSLYQVSIILGSIQGQVQVPSSLWIPSSSSDGCSHWGCWMGRENHTSYLGQSQLTPVVWSICQ